MFFFYFLSFFYFTELHLCNCFPLLLMVWMKFNLKASYGMTEKIFFCNETLYIFAYSERTGLLTFRFQPRVKIKNQNFWNVEQKTKKHVFDVSFLKFYIFPIFWKKMRRSVKYSKVIGNRKKISHVIVNRRKRKLPVVMGNNIFPPVKIST